MIFTNGLGNRFNVIEKGNEANGNCLFESLSYLDLKHNNKSLNVNNIHKNSGSLRKKLYNNYKDYYNNQLSNKKYKANDWQSIKDIYLMLGEEIDEKSVNSQSEDSSEDIIHWKNIENDKVYASANDLFMLCFILKKNIVMYRENKSFEQYPQSETKTYPDTFNILFRRLGKDKDGVINTRGDHFNALEEITSSSSANTTRKDNQTDKSSDKSTTRSKRSNSRDNQKDKSTTQKKSLSSNISGSDSKSITRKNRSFSKEKSSDSLLEKMKNPSTRKAIENHYKYGLNYKTLTPEQLEYVLLQYQQKNKDYKIPSKKESKTEMSPLELKKTRVPSIKVLIWGDEKEKRLYRSLLNRLKYEDEISEKEKTKIQKEIKSLEEKHGTKMQIV